MSVLIRDMQHIGSHVWGGKLYRLYPELDGSFSIGVRYFDRIRNRWSMDTSEVYNFMSATPQVKSLFTKDIEKHTRKNGTPASRRKHVVHAEQLSFL